MPTTFFQLWNELIGEMGSDYPPARAKLDVNKAYQEILNARPWSFLLAEGVFLAPSLITGNVTFTQYSTSAVPDATLKATLDALASQPPITRRAIRITTPSSPTTPNNTRIYQIYGYDSSGAGTITLHQQYTEPSGTSFAMIYRQYYTSPLDENNLETNDFLRYVSVKDFLTNQELVLNYDITWLNRIDTNRTSTGTPQVLVQAPLARTTFPGVSATGPLLPGTPLYEIWPQWVGTDQRTYLAIYQRRGVPLTDDFGDVGSVLPYQIDPEFVFSGARKRAYRWGMVNQGKLTYLRGVPWLQMVQEAQTQWESLYLDMRRLDEEIYMQNVVKRWPWLNSWNMSADYLQSHAGPFDYVGGYGGWY